MPRGAEATTVEQGAMNPDRTAEQDTARESLSILAAIADYHDDDSSQHARRVGIGAALIAQALELPEAFVDLIRDAAPLHDIGKVGISRRILLKPGELTPPEWMHMMRHVEIGAQILAPARSPVLRLAAEIARTHHERWDGNGYVAGLLGEEIPLSGRITALSDVWDTLTHERPYKPAWSEERARAEIDRESGSHFEPRVVEAFGTIDRRALNELPIGDRGSLSG
jgi:putative two-component system response regulator